MKATPFLFGLTSPWLFFAVITACLGASLSSLTAAESPETVAAGEKRREEISLGGDFKPSPKVPAFVVAGHGGRIIVSRDDGKTWRDLPAAVPLGQIIASDKGTLISIHPQRTNILRSSDGGKTWQEVHSYQHDKVEGGAQGLRDSAFGFLTAK